MEKLVLMYMEEDKELTERHDEHVDCVSISWLS
ncbi:hypothetical protein JOC94_002225 [Bacillus thermophilus]|uniref:Uncharacterized protein n=1 Tax=Siminovitchia thermophila TaxID=1245522 RepID=A0ABS2R6J6_9BACI|nr:hypothetical protein [Siminovitchia thermophila]